MVAKRKQAAKFEVTVVYTPAPDCNERLKRVMAVLLHPPSPEEKKAQTEEVAQHDAV